MIPSHIYSITLYGLNTWFGYPGLDMMVWIKLSAIFFEAFVMSNFGEKLFGDRNGLIVKHGLTNGKICGRPPATPPLGQGDIDYLSWASSSRSSRFSNPVSSIPKPASSKSNVSVTNFSARSVPVTMLLDRA
jgi:hypothetical protein